MYLGIDSGSTSTKLAVIDGSGQLLAHRVAETGPDCGETAARLWDELRVQADLSPGAVKGTVATGYGRGRIAMADRRVTEITCHAVGVHHLVPDALSIIDMGGQDSKVIRLDDSGRVEDFAMNDKCAAGTGRFLEVIARRFNMTVDQLGDVAASDAPPITINSTCTVFAETEVVGLLAEGHAREAILAGVHMALARRVAAMFDQVGGRGPVAFSGGVALNPAMVRALGSCLKTPLAVAPHPQLTAALGAALLAANR
ncbi:MAG: 2-hydroxyglutaryl-CoA dehydratase [Planctomycetes bacterium]|nr:2-hydroxyglutaryl-CoA dehydratase [Planctomycetota bacterium]